MQPAKKNPSEDELISHVVHTLQDHEEPYLEGSWENFNEENSDHRSVILWLRRIGSAAAVLLLSFGLYWFISPLADQGKIGEVVTRPVHKRLPSAKRPGAEVLTADPYVKRDVPVSQIELASRIPPRSGTSLALIAAALPEPTLDIAEVQSDNLDKERPISTGTPERTIREAKSFEEFLKEEGSKTAALKQIEENSSKDAKWEMGLLVAPSVGNTKKLNMGYGFSMGYALSQKISINSGVSYNELNASRNVYTPVNMSIAGNNKSLESVDTKVIGIDIPLELKYRLNRNVYVNMGVSAFAVIDQKQSNRYVQERLVQQSPVSNGGKDAFENTLVIEKTVEAAPESEIDSDKYLGFYNFSLGYQQKIFKGNSFSIEPFVKLPMKEISEKNLKLVGTGVRLKFDF